MQGKKSRPTEAYRKYGEEGAMRLTQQIAFFQDPLLTEHAADFLVVADDLEGFLMIESGDGGVEAHGEDGVGFGENGIKFGGGARAENLAFEA